MNKTIKKWLIAASVLFLSGALLFVIAFAALDFKFGDIGTHKYETNIYELSEDFDHIRVNVIDARIIFAVSHDGKCRIECLEQENLKHSAMVQNGVLVIGNTDARKWYDSFGVSFESETVTVYLPKAEYNSLLIKAIQVMWRYLKVFLLRAFRPKRIQLMLYAALRFQVLRNFMPIPAI